MQEWYSRIVFKNDIHEWYSRMIFKNDIQEWYSRIREFKHISGLYKLDWVFWNLLLFYYSIMGYIPIVSKKIQLWSQVPSKAFGQVVNIGNPTEVTINQLAAQVKKLTKSRSEIVHISYEEAYQDGGFEDMRRRVPSIDKAKRLIGFAPKKTLQDIIRDVARQMKNKVWGNIPLTVHADELDNGKYRDHPSRVWFRW